MIEIRLLCSPGVIRIATIQKQRLLDFAIWYPGHPDCLENIYLGHVSSYLPALGGAFITLGTELTGFLADNAGAKNLTKGDWVTVKVSRSAQGGKGLRLDSRNIEQSYHLLEKHTPHLIKNGLSPFEELASRWQEANIYIEDPSLIHLIPDEYKSRIRLIHTELNSELLEQIDALENQEVELPMGMKATIIPTPAAVIIDIDTAILSNDHQNKVRSQFNANHIALPHLLHQLRLRNLSGAIIVDMAGLPVKKRRLFYKEFEKHLQNDPLNPKFYGFTQLGFAEISRPRKRPPLHELLFSDHGRAIQILAKVEQHFKNLPQYNQYRHITITINHVIYQALQTDPWAINHFKERCSVSLNFESNPNLSSYEWKYHYE